MNALVVGISDCKISGDPDSVLMTYALGSCVAVAVHDPVARVSGLLHFMLPEASIDQAKAEQNPYMFADTGVTRMLDQVMLSGANRRRLVVRIAGGAQVLNGHELFQIGKRNYVAARKLLWKAGLLVAAEAVGGEVSRTVRLEVATGKTWIREGAVEKPLEHSSAGKGIANGVHSSDRR
ncbi:MAG TPA: chemotaxis protein CheD [Bryobacteraceae bacterium]|nr:chemotaxis protein CheD [Bryobacteraceae bacterium]